MREEFENWCREYFGWDESRFDMHAGEYINGKTYEKWECWQASRATMVVRLPRARSDVDHGYESCDIQNLLTDAGISYE